MVVKYEEGMTGKLTMRAKIYRLTTGEHGHQRLVELTHPKSFTPIMFTEDELDEYFEVDEPEYEPGAVYQDANGDFWTLNTNQYTGESTGTWLAFGCETEFHFDTPRRPLHLVS